LWGSNTDVERAVPHRWCTLYITAQWYSGAEVGAGAGPAGSGDDRMLQLMRFFNGLMDKHPQTRRRQLSFFTPIMLNVVASVSPLSSSWPTPSPLSCSIWLLL
jgi:hypothetical protein